MSDERADTGRVCSNELGKYRYRKYDFAEKPGDGSAREQAASCQKVLGGWANIAREYATKRYRSNLINWGMLPFLFTEEQLPFAKGDYLYIPNIQEAVKLIKEADVLIVGGTSLGVYPAAGLIDYYNGNKLVLINKSETPYDRRADLLIHDALGNVFPKFKRLLNRQKWSIYEIYLRSRRYCPAQKKTSVWQYRMANIACWC